MPDDLLAQTLNSKQLLALVYVCQRQRNNTPLSTSDLFQNRPADWNAFLDAFYVTLEPLGEVMRFEILEAHLMNEENIDIYDNKILRDLLKSNSEVMQLLTKDLDKNPKFQTA